MNSIVYIVGAIVIIAAVLSFFWPALTPSQFPAATPESVRSARLPRRARAGCSVRHRTDNACDSAGYSRLSDVRMSASGGRRGVCRRCPQSCRSNGASPFRAASTENRQTRKSHAKHHSASLQRLFGILFVAMALGCASTAKQEGTGEYVDDTVITGKVKAAIFNEPTLKSAEINVETFKGVVQLSGFVELAPRTKRRRCRLRARRRREVGQERHALEVSQTGPGSRAVSARPADRGNECRQRP